MNTPSSATISSPPNPTSSFNSSLLLNRTRTTPHLTNTVIPSNALFHRLHHAHAPVRVANESAGTEVTTAERSEADRMVDGMDFGELCNEFECISSPLVESTARQLVRDILELREGNRALGTFAVSVKYKDPVRSFTGRDKYKRQLWATDALENPRVTVQQMMMLSTSVLNIKWTLIGKPKSPIFSIGGDLIVKVNSIFTLNQISGQVIEHQESWDLSELSLPAQVYFWTSKRLFATVQAGKDISDFVKDLPNRVTPENKNVEIYPDPTGDPTKVIQQYTPHLLSPLFSNDIHATKLYNVWIFFTDKFSNYDAHQFFQRDDSFQRDFYQIALFLAVLYFVVQYLQTTL